jgi:hypothetical protein
MTRATLIAGAAGGLLAVLLLAPATGTALGELSRARAARAEAAAFDTRSPTSLPLVAPALRIVAPNEAEAARALASRVRTLAAQGGVLVEQAQGVRGSAGLARLRLRLSGPDKAVIALADRLERDAPLLRLRSWQITALGDGGLRLDGEAVAAWR